MKIKLLLFILILFSCSSKNDFRSIGGVEFAERSSEPFLYSSGDDLIISWTENKYDTNYLYTAEYLKDSWDNKELITDGQDWFVNWADFPSISYNEVSNVKLSHHLQKVQNQHFPTILIITFLKKEGGSIKINFIMMKRKLNMVLYLLSLIRMVSLPRG